jgi:hypothetical protein
MRTDLVGGADFLAKVQALQAQHEDARTAREGAAGALKAAKVADVAAGAEALRKGSKAPTLTEPEAQKAYDDAARTFEVVTLALRKEREALVEDIASRSDEIRATLAKAEDEADEAILTLAGEIEELLRERAEVKAHVIWLEDPARQIGNAPVVGLEALTALRTQLGKEPGTASSRQQEKADHDRRTDEWNALVQRAVRGHSFEANSQEYRELETEGAIEAEIERMQEAGEDVPRPTNRKWLQKLGLTAKPKGQGTGWARLPKVVPTTLTPDTDSAEARRRDLVPA